MGHYQGLLFQQSHGNKAIVTYFQPVLRPLEEWTNVSADTSSKTSQTSCEPQTVSIFLNNSKKRVINLPLNWLPKYYYLWSKMVPIHLKLAKLHWTAFQSEEGTWNALALRMSTWVGKHMFLLSRGSGTPGFLPKCEAFINSCSWRCFK